MNLFIVAENKNESECKMQNAASHWFVCGFVAAVRIKSHTNTVPSTRFIHDFTHTHAFSGDIKVYDERVFTIIMSFIHLNIMFRLRIVYFMPRNATLLWCAISTFS